MLQFPGIKINIGLYITQRRTDGFHDLATVFYPLPVCDALEVVKSGWSSGSQLFFSGRHIDSDPHENLVWRAYTLLAEEYPDQVTPVDIYLHKNIPMGAGLGGGSSDGAFALRMLNEYYRLELAEEKLMQLALRLGSDCPFFIRNMPQYATGRGEIMEPVALDLSRYSIQLICPQVHVATRWAFGHITPHPAPVDLRTLPGLPISEWSSQITNVFEKPIFREYPLLADIKEQLYRQGALYAAMSGSGSSIFGIFDKQKRADIRANISFEEFYID